MTEQFFGKELAVRKSEAIPGLLEFDFLSYNCNNSHGYGGSSGCK